MLNCDRIGNGGQAVERLLATAGVRMIRTPFRAPNCNVHAERLVRSIKAQCLDRVIPLGERHLRRALADFVRITIASETSKGWATNSSSIGNRSMWRALFAGDVTWVDFSVITTVPQQSDD